MRDAMAAWGADTAKVEPQVPAEILDAPRAVLAPHVGSATAETRQAMLDLARYRLQYSLYKSELPLQQAHARLLRVARGDARIFERTARRDSPPHRRIVRREE